MIKPKMYRKRFEPDEIVDISNDKLIYRDNEIIATSWLPIKKREDISYGNSFTFIKEGYKISEIYGPNQEFEFWYCDIIDTKYDKEKDEYTFIDLLIDVKVYEDGFYEILDVEEVALLLKDGRIASNEVIKGLTNLDKLLKIIYTKKFPPQICIQIKNESNMTIQLGGGE